MRRLNYTGRRNLKQASVALEVVAAKDGSLSVKGSIDLSVYGEWPPDAEVVIEAWQGPAFERILVGKTDQLKVEFDLPLRVFRGEQSPQFRVKVVAKGGHRGRLLGLCLVRARRADSEGHTSSMLHVTVEPLDHEIYKLRLEENKHPVLVINENLPAESELSGKALALHPMFISIVMPQIVRAVLSDILLVRRLEGVDEEQPEGQWVSFAESLNADRLPASDDVDGRRAWIEQVAEEFAKRTDALGRFKLWSVR